MRKLLLFAILAIASIVPAAAQFRFGAEAGVNFPAYSSSFDTKVGFNVGATAEYSFTPNWLLEAALKLSSQPAVDTYYDGYYDPETNTYLQGDTEIKSTVTPYYLVLPIRAAARFNISQNCKLSVGVGPSFGIGLFGRWSGKITENNVSIKEHTNQLFHGEKYFSSSRFQAGVNARVGVELFNHYTVGLEYNYWHISGKQKITDSINMLSLTVGYKF